MPRAQRVLGIMYVKGIGVVTDYVRAEKWLLAAAEQGDGEAMYALSELYTQGADGVEKSEDRANRYQTFLERTQARVCIQTSMLERYPRRYRLAGSSREAIFFTQSTRCDTRASGRPRAASARSVMRTRRSRSRAKASTGPTPTDPAVAAARWL